MMEPKGLVAASQPRWIPVTERLPESGVMVLVHDGKKMYDLDWVAHFPNNMWMYENILAKYWMPLPEPPKEVSE